RRRWIVVVVDLGVGDVREDDQVELFGELHGLDVEVEIGGGSGWVGWVAEHDRKRLRDRVPDRPLDAAQELRVRVFCGGCASGSRNVADRGSRNNEAELVNGISRARYQDHIARGRYGFRHVWDSVLLCPALP